MPHALCHVPAAPVRKEASHRSEMTNQLLFGEAVEILESEKEWRRVRSVYDNYEGWVTHHLIEEVAEVPPSVFVTTELVTMFTRKGSMMHVPMGSALPGFKEGSRTFWNDTVECYGNYRNTTNVDPSLIIPTAMTWLNAPYLWGGKTLMGVDCSGFVQTVFKVAGIRLHRDAYQQAQQGVAVPDLASSKPGDLCFFSNESDRITHVGMVLDEVHAIIHASGRVKIDYVDAEGILNLDTGQRTHKLHSINRYV